MKNLKELELNSWQIKDQYAAAFEKLHLEELYLDNPNPNIVLHLPENLNFLDLSDSTFTKNMAEAVSRRPLTALDLSSINLQSEALSSLQAPTLEELEISLAKNLSVDSLHSLSGLPILNYLAVHSSSLSEIPDLRHLRKLKYLSLGGNQLTKIDNELITPYESLYLDRNELRGPISIKSNHLTHLNLKDNFIEQAKIEAEKIVFIELSVNNLTNFPEIIGPVEQLHLEKNKLACVLKFKSSTAKSLFLKNNSIEEVVITSPAISFIDLSHNQLKAFPKIDGPLKTLHLEQNNFPENLHIDHDHLERIYLQNNQIEKLSATTPSLSIINLTNNKLKSFPEIKWTCPRTLPRK